MSKNKNQFYNKVYNYLEELENAEDHEGTPSLFINDLYGNEEYQDYSDFEEWEQNSLFALSERSKAENIKHIVTGTVGAATTDLTSRVIIWPLTKIAEMGVTAVYIAARVSFAGKRGLQDSAEFIKNSVNWMLGDKYAFNNIAQMNNLKENIQTEMIKIVDIYNNSEDKELKDKYLKYMTDHDAASKKPNFSTVEKIKLQKKFLESLSKNKDMDFYKENKNGINGILENIQKHEKLNHIAEETYRRSKTNEALTKILKKATETVNIPLKKANELTCDFITDSNQASYRLKDQNNRNNLNSPKANTRSRNHSFDI